MKPASKGEVKSKNTKKSSSKPTTAEPEEAEPETTFDEEEEELDDQTRALVEGLDSEDEEEDSADEDAPEKSDAAKKVPKLPASATKAIKAKTKSGGEKEDVGVIYVGRIPHGFFEHEMQQYFSQFGPVTRLRLSRNKKTGASKHFAFVEFAEASTAEIVAKTMDNYLLFGRILRCKLVPKEQVHENLFIGANRRFKKVPWNKMAGRQLERPASEAKWEARNSKEEKRRAARAAKLKQIMDYDFEAPALKTAEAKAIEAPEDASTKAIESTSAPDEDDAIPAEDKALVPLKEADPETVKVPETKLKKAKGQVKAKASKKKASKT